MTITLRQVIAQLIRGHYSVPGNEAARYAALRTVVGTNWIAVVWFIIFWSCDRLSWLYRQLPSARWYSVIIIDTSSVMKYFSYNLAPQHGRTAVVYTNKASYKVSSSKSKFSTSKWTPPQIRCISHHRPTSRSLPRIKLSITHFRALAPGMPRYSKSATAHSWNNWPLIFHSSIRSAGWDTVRTGNPPVSLDVRSAAAAAAAASAAANENHCRLFSCRKRLICVIAECKQIWQRDPP